MDEGAALMDNGSGTQSEKDRQAKAAVNRQRELNEKHKARRAA